MIFQFGESADFEELKIIVVTMICHSCDTFRSNDDIAYFPAALII
jgi:hypothetical protein